MREQWTDERLDDLNRYVRDGFDRIDKDLRALRAEMSAEIGGLRAETNARFDSLQRTLLQLGGGMFVTFVVGFASLLVTQG